MCFRGARAWLVSRSFPDSLKSRLLELDVPHGRGARHPQAALSLGRLFVPLAIFIVSDLPRRSSKACLYWVRDSHLLEEVAVLHSSHPTPTKEPTSPLTQFSRWADYHVDSRLARVELTGYGNSRRRLGYPRILDALGILRPPDNCSNTVRSYKPPLEELSRYHYAFASRGLTTSLEGVLMDPSLTRFSEMVIGEPTTSPTFGSGTGSQAFPRLSGTSRTLEEGMLPAAADEYGPRLSITDALDAVKPDSNTPGAMPQARLLLDGGRAAGRRPATISPSTTF
ncbi:hypothetical protein M407DRAFT_9130 [Tulasnella calospora MUT 4182]|uniref:Uncharacterized protein n=1 Tax=Tulasnella calospora MUT 4182 TaxID=1051891 RepID=A0A0C3QE58_9AGAM|nr:hypothetical protein M407DRAFT_9130 [Tulasnella calospora MUT 4182]